MDWHGRRRPHRGLKVKSHIHCMGIGQLCKNIEGDPAKVRPAATTCWQRSQSMNYVGVCIRLGPEKVAESFFTPTILNQ